MTIASNKLAVAALAGLLSASVITTGIAHADKGAAMQKAAVEKTDATLKEKHACKGLNACKGMGADGKNACKGHGSCRTDGKTSDKDLNR